jgi:hypothetical protein
MKANPARHAFTGGSTNYPPCSMAAPYEGYGPFRWWIIHPSFLTRLTETLDGPYACFSEGIRTQAQAWEIVFAYRRRWKVETAFRYGKCELGMESPRLWDWENRLKLLSLVTIVYTFLLALLDPLHQELVKAVLQVKCHRTGKRCQEVQAPLYRLRWAISRLWDDVHPILGSLFPPNLQTIRALASLGCWTASQKSLG